LSAANDRDEFIAAPPSPCVRNCCLDDDKICMGCHRSLAEICAWHEAPASEKIEILIRCRARYRERHEKHRG
jgi:predicted Fe-S protein YdhL (DUF1289 family)